MAQDTKTPEELAKSLKMQRSHSHPISGFGLVMPEQQAEIRFMSEATRALGFEMGMKDPWKVYDAFVEKHGPLTKENLERAVRESDISETAKAELLKIREEKPSNPIDYDPAPAQPAFEPSQGDAEYAKLKETEYEKATTADPGIPRTHGRDHFANNARKQLGVDDAELSDQDVNARVKGMQEFLNVNGHTIKIDGKFGDETKKAYEAYVAANGHDPFGNARGADGKLVPTGRNPMKESFIPDNLETLFPSRQLTDEEIANMPMLGGRNLVTGKIPGQDFIEATKQLRDEGKNIQDLTPEQREKAIRDAAHGGAEKELHTGKVLMRSDGTTTPLVKEDDAMRKALGDTRLQAGISNDGKHYADGMPEESVMSSKLRTNELVKGA